MRRAALCFLIATIFALESSSAWPQAAWDPTFGGPGIAYSNSNKTAAGQGTRVSLAIDFGGKVMFSRAPYDGRWRGAGGSVNANIASVTGYDISAFGTSAMAVAVYFGNSLGVKIHTGSTIESPIPSGYVSLETACGAAVSFTSSAKGSNVTLSGSNKVATSGASGGQNGVKTDCTIALGTSVKVMVELEIPASGSAWGSPYEFGLVNSTWDGNTENLANTANAATWWSNSCCTPGWYRNGSGDQTINRMDNGSVPVITNASNFARPVVATVTPITSGKKVYYEIKIDVIAGGFVVGLADGNMPPIDTTNQQRAYPGNPDTGGIGIQSAAIYGSTTSATIPTFVDGDVVGFAVDTNTSPAGVWARMNISGTPTWVGRGGGCGTADPVSGTCPFTNAALSSSTLYPAGALYSQTSNAGGTISINGGSTSFTFGPPTGFCALDTPSCGTPSPSGPRGRIWGHLRAVPSNDNARNCALEVAS